MKALRIVLVVIGVLIIALGALWVGQGTGTVPYPAGNFMINDINWAYRGAGAIIIGLILIVLSRRV